VEPDPFICASGSSSRARLRRYASISYDIADMTHFGERAQLMRIFWSLQGLLVTRVMTLLLLQLFYFR